MITFGDFKKIDSEVKASTLAVMSYLEKNSMDYILLLANGEYKKQYDYPIRLFNPYIIDSREDKHKDTDRPIAG